MPAVVIGNPAAKRRTDRGRDNDGHAIHGKGHAALLCGEGVRQDRLFARLQAASARALQNAEEDQHGQSWCQSAQKRTDGEDGDARHVEALAADHI